MNVPDEERFWPRVAKTPDGCWVWTGGKAAHGYGSFFWAGKARGAHRFAFELAYGGTIPDGMRVLHTCDNPSCVRNDDVGWYEVNGILHPRRGHLWIGTAADNTADMTNKGRAYATPPPPQYGQDHPRSKLSDDDVRTIRGIYHSSRITQTALAHRYGVSQATIGMIVHNKVRILHD